MPGRVPSIAVEARQVDSTDEGHLIVDHDRLFMMAVHRPLAGIQRALDAGPSHKLFADSADVTAPRTKDGKGRTRPDQHPNGDPGCNLSEQLS